MGAYAPDGQLWRVIEATARRKKEEEKGGGKEYTPKSKEGEEDDLDDWGFEKGEKDTSKLPPETTRDWAPFPLNRTFISQPVLSDELREEIWSRIMKEGKTVREVSAELGVEMRRVGAVVRLKEVEKEWKRIVSFSPFHDSSPQSTYDDIIKID
jgi:hypothetical protein